MEDDVVRGFDGVPVRGVGAFDEAADSCLVGDFVGDCKMC
jgi:hypothetical protein